MPIQILSWSVSDPNPVPWDLISETASRAFIDNDDNTLQSYPFIFAIDCGIGYRYSAESGYEGAKSAVWRLVSAIGDRWRGGVVKIRWRFMLGFRIIAIMVAVYWASMSRLEYFLWLAGFLVLFVPWRFEKWEERRKAKRERYVVSGKSDAPCLWSLTLESVCGITGSDGL